jgi:anti-anti-sigma factor
MLQEPVAMEIRKKTRQDSAILELTGEFDLNEVELFEGAFRELVDNPEYKRIILDFKLLTFLGSSGISSLIGMSRLLGGQKEGHIYILNANDYIRDLVRMTGIESIVRLIDAWEYKRLTGQDIHTGS